MASVPLSLSLSVKKGVAILSALMFMFKFLSFFVNFYVKKGLIIIFEPFLFYNVNSFSEY